MGGNVSRLTEDELEDYNYLTYLTKSEIVHAFNRFRNLDSAALNRDKGSRLPFSTIMQMPEFKNNPFSDRLCKVFSSENDERLSFEDFLDLIAVLSESAPAKKKSAYAFKIYDFDEDGFISKSDVAELIERMSGEQSMRERFRDILALKTIQEGDLDKDGKLSYAEFDHIVSKSPDFLTTFNLRL